MRKLLIFGLCLFYTLAYAQQDSVSRKEFETYKDKIKIFLKEKNIDTIGKFSLRKNDTYVYSKEGNKATDTLRIISVEISLKDGFLEDVFVRGALQSKEKDTITFRNSYSISLLKYNLRYFKWRLNYKNEKEIKIFDFLKFENRAGKGYVPDDSVFFLGNEKTIINDNSLNKIINVRVYSDLLGLFNESSNGIVNFEAEAKIFLNPINWFNTHFFKHISPELKYARFDNKDGNVLVGSDSLLINKLDLVQKSYLSVGAKLNFFEFRFRKPSLVKFSIPMKMNFSIAKMQLENGEELNNSNVFNFGTGLDMYFEKSTSFGMHLSILYDTYNHKINTSNNYKREEIFETIGTNAELFFYSSKNKESALFLRLNYKQTLFEDNNNNFSSIQLGYKTALKF